MSRPKSYAAPRVSTALRLPVDLHDRIKAAAADRDVSTNWLMERLLADGVDRLIPVDELVLTRSEPPVT